MSEWHGENELLPGLLPRPAEPPTPDHDEVPATCIPAGHGPFTSGGSGIRTPEVLPQHAFQVPQRGWGVFAGVRLRRSARCADGSHDPWIGLDREELLPKLLPLRGRGTGGVEPGSRPALGQAVVALAGGIGAQATSQLTRGVTGSRLGGCSARCASRDHLPGSTSWSTLPGERGSSSTTT